MPLSERFVFSQSSLQDYADCPRRFQLRYLDQLSYPAVESEPTLENERRQQEGQYFHRLVQQHFLGIPDEKLSRLANTPNLQRWWENLVNDKELTRFRHLPELYPEMTLSASLEASWLVAKYDLIAVTDDERFSIYDWKTYQHRPSNERLAARWQTRVYLALLAAAGSRFNGGRPLLPERCEMVYWFADFPDDPARFPYNEVKFKQDWQALVNMTQEIRAASTFPMTNDLQKCSYCAYRSYCARGVRAGDSDTGEAELQSASVFDVDFEQIGEIAF